jgi:hypothetical protein
MPALRDVGMQVAAVVTIGRRWGFRTDGGWVHWTE